MASNTINFKGTFDASEILKSLQQIRQQMKQAGASSSLFDGIDKDMEKAQTLIASLTAQIQKGFKNPKEVQSFAKEFDKLDTYLVKIQNGFKEINTAANFNTKTGEINKLTQKLEEATAKQKDYAEAARKAIDSQLDDLNLKEKDIKAIKKEIASQEELERVLKQVGQAREKAAQRTIGDKYQGSATAQAEAMDVTKSAIQTKQISFNAGPGITQEQGLSQFNTAYLKILDESLKKGLNAAQAYGKLREELQKYQITLNDTDQSQEAFNEDLSRINQIVYNEASPQVKGAITKARTAATSMGSTDENGEFQLRGAAAGLLTNTDVQNHIRNEQLIEQATAQRQQLQEQGEQEAEGAVRRHDQALEEETQHEKQLSTSVNQATQELYEQSSAAQQVNNSFENMKNTVKMVLSITSAWQAFKNVIRQTFEDVKNLDKAFGSIAMVTNKTVGELWASYGQYAEMANKLGQSTADAIKASALFYQQGLDTAEALSLTEDTMKLATLSGQGFEQATQQMTAALRGFHMEMEEGSHITDVYSELAAHAAADVHGIAYAMSKTASIANNAGMSFENTSAFLTQMIETTQEAPENIGTAMKTIIARFTELKENVAGTADSEFEDLDYNKVDKALKTVGVSLKDANGQFRNLDDVFLELSSKWNTLDRNSQRYIATIAAGSRQQSRFIAMMENYERTMELVETAQDSAGRSEEQFAKYQDTVEYKLNQLKNSWEQLRVSFMDSDVFKGAIDQINGIVTALQGVDFKKLLVMSPIIISIAKNFVMSFINTVQGAANNFRQLGSSIFEAIKKGLSKKAKELNIPINVKIRDAEQQYETQKSILEKFMQSHKPMVNLEIQTGKSASELLALKNSGDQFDQIAQKLGMDVDALERQLKELELEEQNLGTTALKANQSMQAQAQSLELLRQKAQQQAQALSMVGQAISVGIMTAISTKDIDAAINSVLVSLAAFGTQAITLFMSKMAEATAIAYAESGQLGIAMGEGLAAGWAATGVGIIIVLITAAIAGAIKGIKYLIDIYKSNHKSLEEQLEDAKKQQAEAEKIANETKSQAKESKEAYESVSKLKEEYEDLSKKAIKTTEEQERYNELVEQIRNDFPEIVTYYNEATNELRIQNDLWDNIIAKKKQLYQEDEIKSLSAQFRNLEAQQNYNDKSYQSDLSKTLNYKEITGKVHWFTVNESLGEMAKNYLDNGVETSDKIKELSADIAAALNLNFENSDDLNNYIKALYLLENRSVDQYSESAYYTDEVKNIMDQLISLKDTEKERVVGIARQKGVKDAYAQQEKMLLASSMANSRLGTNDLNQYLSKDLIEQVQQQRFNLTYGNYAKYMDFEDAAAFEKYIEDNKLNKEEYLKSIAESVWISDKINEISEESYQKAQEQAEKLKDLSYKDLQSESGNGEYGNYINQYRDSLIKQREEDLQNIAQYSENLASTVEDFSASQVEILNGNIQTVLDDYGSFAAQAYSDILAEMVEENNLTGEDLSNFLNLADWSKADPTNWKEFKQTLIDNLEESGIEGAEKLVEQIVPKLEEIGVIDITINNDLELDTFIAKLKETRELAYKEKDTIFTAIANQASQGKIELDEYLKLADSLTKMGENIDDYVNVNNGQYVLDAEKLEEVYRNQTSELAKQLEIERDKTIAQRDKLIGQKAEIEKQLAILESIDAQDKVGNEVYINTVKRLKSLFAIVQSGLQKFGFDIDLTSAFEFLDDSTTSESSVLKEALTSITEDISSMDSIIDSYEEKIDKLRKEDEVYSNDATATKTKKLQENAKKIEDAAKKVADAEEKVAEATKKLNEALYGLEEHKNKLDFLYNYQTNLDRITKKANEAKEALEDLKGESATEQLDKYLSGVHSEAVTRRAENQVIQNSIDNYQSVLDTKLAEKIAEINAANPSRNLSTNVSDYYTKVGDRLNVNFQALNAAQLPDDLSDYVEETIEQINKLSDEIEKNDEELKKREKEFLDMQKKARQDYIKLEDQVVSTLKEKYDEEIKATEDKYKAIEEADNEYLDALKEAIDKQRKLRDQANQWEDLQTKEKKLALMQRDTSGANASEINSLQEEIENDREQLLDNAVDNILDSLKEMYDLQKETRDAELEYQKAVLDNAVLVQEANAIIDSWNSADDAVAWFYENTQDLSEMSVAKLEEETEQWRELYDTKTTYMATSQADFEAALSTTAEEIQSIVDATSEALTTEADRSLTEITNKVTEAIKSAEKTLEDAIKALEEAKQSYSDATGGPGSNAGGNPNSSEQIKAPHFENGKTTILKGTTGNYAVAIGETRDAASYSGDILTIRSDGGSIFPDKAILGTKDIYTLLQNNDEQAIRQLSMLLYGNINADKKTILKDYPSLGQSNRKRLNAYASGGLVNYTGPAWVDGTPSKPEAFLSPEDTQRIGAAAQLLSNLPILNSTSNANTTVTSNVGDTAIDIHINIENVSSDYDVDQMIERVKQDIVDVSNPIGSPIILRK